MTASRATEFINVSVADGVQSIQTEVTVQGDSFVGWISGHPTRSEIVNRVRFVWTGGPYVEFALSNTLPQYDDTAPLDVFNVWDYATDTPTIERTSFGFARWLAALDDDDVDRIVEACQYHGQPLE